MKKIIFSLAAVVAFFTADAQKLVTQKYPNGNKMAEGMMFGEESTASDSKDAAARKSTSQFKDGKWLTWYENGNARSEEYYSNGTMIGNWKMLFDNGQTEFEINFTTGKAVYFFKNGAKHSEGSIKNGMVTVGNWTGYYENGNKNYEGSYNEQGQKNGTWKWYDNKGNLTTEQTYTNGTLTNTKTITK